mmetsp:Transcript_93155/g.301186  ORF Transcript_93155/g.301186 Transcript_93155/m.301186 type:complete len:217 (-) Transcript_93155:1843-2493(-)
MRPPLQQQQQWHSGILHFWAQPATPLVGFRRRALPEPWPMRGRLLALVLQLLLQQHRSSSRSLAPTLLSAVLVAMSVTTVWRLAALLLPSRTEAAVVISVVLLPSSTTSAALGLASLHARKAKAVVLALVVRSGPSLISSLDMEARVVRGGSRSEEEQWEEEQEEEQEEQEEVTRSQSWRTYFPPTTSSAVSTPLQRTRRAAGCYSTSWTKGVQRF